MQPSNRTRLAAAVVAAAAALPTAFADVERTVEYRQSVYRVIAWNFGTLRAMARGEMPFDTAIAEKRSQRIAQLSLMLDDAYDEPSTGYGSDAKELIWEDFADFEEKLGAFQAEAAKLAQVAAGGDEGAIKAQFVEMAGTCKACHDRYKD